ncbi:MAG: cephalosporin hydroxylase family protein [Allosphingosinicella sp.]
MSVTIIDEEKATVTVRQDGREMIYPMASSEAFAAASRAWLRAGWDVKHVYSFTWMGRPIIQLPEDMVRLQELIWSEKPDVIVETGIAHGGSLIFYASLFEAMGRGRVIGVDIEIRPHNRTAIEAHPMFGRIDLVEGSSTAPDIVADVRGRIRPGEKVMVLLDSNHSRAHVLDELRAYAPLVDVGDYLVATDGIMQDLVEAPRSAPDWDLDNPQQAARDFVAEDDRFAIEEPAWLFNEGEVRERVTYWPACYVRRVR